MSATSRGSKAALPFFKRTGSPQICVQCAQGRRFGAPARPYSAAAAAAAIPIETSTPPPSESLSSRPASATQPSLYRIKSGIILSRPPLITAPLHPFESAFFLYQKRLNERLTAPFSKKFYFKRDTAVELDWKIKVRERGTVAKEVGAYTGRGPAAWDDEVLVGSELGSQEAIREALVRDAEMRVSEDGEELSAEDRVRVEAPMPRETEADRKGDVRRLDRKLDRTLYLVVKGKDGAWSFPAGGVTTDENLHEAAARILEDSAGANMNIWMVGRIPVGHHVSEPVLTNDGAAPEQKGEKIFFLKGRILAGQADLTENKLGLSDFKWLTKEEVEKEVDTDYFHSVRNTMGAR